MFPNGIHIEDDPEHLDFFVEMRTIVPTLTCHISHLDVGAEAVFKEAGLKGARLNKKRVQTINKAEYKAKKAGLPPLAPHPTPTFNPK